MLKKNLLITFILLLAYPTVSQNQIKDSLLFSSIKKKSKKHNSNQYFYKSSIAFQNKNWDSTLIFTNKYLNSLKVEDTNISAKDYCKYFRGLSFLRKKLIKQAKEEFISVSSDFDFYHMVKLYLGEVLIFDNKYKEAIPYLKEATILSKDKYPYIRLRSVFQNLGICFLQLKEYKKAENYFNKSLKNEKDTLELISHYTNIANVYYNQYIDDKAIKHFTKAYRLSKKLQSNNTKIFEDVLKIYYRKRIATKNMAVVEENRKNFKKALAYRKEHEKYIDTINNRNTIYEIAQKEKEFAVKEKQKEVTFLEAENKIKEAQKKELLYAAIVLLTLLLTIIYFYREKVKRNKIIAHQKEDLDALNATKDKLFSIVSHDLRSSVNALKSSNVVLLDNLASKNIDALGNLLKKNSAIVNGAYGLLDNLLHWALSQTKQVYFEIKSTRLFFMVEQMAYNYKPLMLEKNIQFENKVSKKDLVLADQESLKLIIRNLLDNAIKFSNKDGKIKVYSRNVQEGFCDLIVEDTGMGMTNETRLKLLEDTLLLSKKEHEDVIGTGLGLQLCKTMVKKNNGKFSIESELGVGTKMIVSLPKKQDNG